MSCVFDQFIRAGFVAAAFAFAILGSAVTASAFQKAPAWLQLAAAASHPSYDAKVPAVVLHRETSITLDNSGKQVKVERTAIKVLTREGRREAGGAAFYLSKFNTVREIEAWMIAPGGTVKSYGKKDVIDRISDPDDIYDEGRIKIIDASGDAEVGSVFGFTSTVEDRPLFFQDKWIFQDELPTLISRYSVEVPDGWKATSITFNRSEVVPSVRGNVYTWELRGMPAIPQETMGPSFVNLAPRLAVNYFPAAGGDANKIFPNWTEVSRWTTGLFDPQVVVNDAVAIKAREITANAKSEFEKIRAIGAFVQNLQYISIDIGVGYGNGMKPRPSDVVLNRGYGDCKDKANLMRALLRALKIEAFPVAIYSGDAEFVRVEWPSPGQFNHCIIAIRVSAETQGPTVVEHPELGRLLIFDATDPFTPVGDLPDMLQGSYGMIAAGDKGGILKMPVTPAEANRLERTVDMAITPQGSISGKVGERTFGQAAAFERGRFRSLSAADYNRVIEHWVTTGASGAKATEINVKDDPQNASFEVSLGLRADSYAQIMQDRLMVFKPAVISRLGRLAVTEGRRTTPFVVDSTAYSEQVRIELPAGFSVDEVPDALNLETSFGKYSATYEVKGSTLVYKRALTLNRSNVPAEKYDAVKTFFGKVHAAEQAPVVLIKK